MGAAFTVHKEQGGGLAEEIYQVCFEMELGFQEIPFEAQSQLKVFYKGHELKKRYVPDLMVFGEIVVELKAVKKLLPEHEAQLLNYMRITKRKSVTWSILLQLKQSNGNGFIID